MSGSQTWLTLSGTQAFLGLLTVINFPSTSGKAPIETRAEGRAGSSLGKPNTKKKNPSPASPAAASSVHSCPGLLHLPFSSSASLLFSTLFGPASLSPSHSPCSPLVCEVGGTVYHHWFPGRIAAQQERRGRTGICTLSPSNPLGKGRWAWRKHWVGSAQVPTLWAPSAC